MSNKIHAPGSDALSEAELDQLAAILTRIRESGATEALSLESLDGFFCALIASPDAYHPSEYLPVVWGGQVTDHSGFASLQEADQAISLLMRHWNAIIHDFDQETVHLPIIDEDAIDGIAGRAWARGFMRGVQLAPRGWKEIFREEGEGLTVTIPLMAGEIDPDWPKEPLDKEKEDELISWMATGAARAYRYFADDRRDLANAQYEDSLDDEAFYIAEPYRRASPKVGRNDPCPCGSGRKYKRCCGRSPSPTH